MDLHYCGCVCIEIVLPLPPTITSMGCTRNMVARTLLCFLLPAALSLPTISTWQVQECLGWLKYWVVLSVALLLEALLDHCHCEAKVGWWQVLKVTLLLWCIAPTQYNGSELLFDNIVSPTFKLLKFIQHTVNIHGPVLLENCLLLANEGCEVIKIGLEYSYEIIKIGAIYLKSGSDVLVVNLIDWGGDGIDILKLGLDYATDVIYNEAFKKLLFIFAEKCKDIFIIIFEKSKYILQNSGNYLPNININNTVGLFKGERKHDRLFSTILKEWTGFKGDSANKIFSDLFKIVTIL